MFGIIFSIIAGITMTLQGIFNTRASEKIGLWEINLIVQGSAFFFTLIAFFLFKDGQISNIKSLNKLYLLGGFLGTIIIYTVMKGIGNLGPTFSISIILVSQLFSAAIIDTFGLFGSTKITLSWNTYLGMALMILGIILFKFKN
ncbi:MAG: DMT family transporter [Sarcina sp.]